MCVASEADLPAPGFDDYASIYYNIGTGDTSAFVNASDSGVTYVAAAADSIVITIPLGVELHRITLIDNGSEGMGTTFSVTIIDQNNFVNQGTIATANVPIIQFVEMDVSPHVDPPTPSTPYHIPTGMAVQSVDLTFGVSDWGSSSITITVDPITSYAEFLLILDW